MTPRMYADLARVARAESNLIGADRAYLDALAHQLEEAAALARGGVEIVVAKNKTARMRCRTGGRGARA